MPPFLPRKRLSVSPPASARETPAKKAKLADVLDAESKSTPGLQRTKTFSLGSDESDSSLSDVDSEQFEKVPSNLKQPSALTHDDEKEEDDDDEDIEWEDAAGYDHEKELPAYKPQSDGPIEINLRKADNEADNWITQAANKRKGPSKREKQVRVCTHQLHVQFLLWHNSVRNSWISDREVQQILVQQLPPPIKKEVEKWKRASGLTVADTEAGGGSATVRGKRPGKQKVADPRNERDWGRPSKRAEQGKPDMSNGDPIISLMKVLAAYWKKKFAITAPGLRKRGYGTRLGLKQIIQSQRNDEHNPEVHGERIRNIQEFRELARRSEGSRDVGAQLFTALLRGLGIEARLVASLQPSGFGWTKAEQAQPRKASEAVDVDTSFDDSGSEDARSMSEINKNPARRKGGPRNMSRNKSELEDEEDSVVDVTPSMPKKRPQKYDRENPFPIYWTEAVSPVTNKILPVSPLVLASPVATTPEILATFEPRGIKAEKTKTVMAYVIAYSPDGSAKDVTVRYLRKRIWPGKTKGFRFPLEKIPVYNRYGKVKRYEDYDWFKRVMSGYTRPDLMRTTVDDVEDATDLVPQLPEKKDSGGQEIDTLQSLKSSADYVLERFLRREEALRPDAEPVRTFISGKGENQKEEPVYRRSDVERCLTAESWHKEGRRPRAGEAPMKLVPVRAVTLTRKREAEEHERVTGEKQMQGLYSWDQTEYIIPPPIENGVIPKNAYGNIDCFVPSMVPKGAVHIPLRGTVRICKKLQIDFAEAVTGFEFGNKRAVPVCTGVVVAKENERAVREAWHKYNEEQRKKEEKKMESMVLEMWRKFVVGLRIRERVRDTYGDQNAADELAIGRSKEQPIMLESDEEALTSHRHEPEPRATEDEFGGEGGFLLESDEEHQVGSDLEVVHHDEPQPQSISKGKERATDYQYPTPASVSASPLKPPLRRQRPGKSFEERDQEQESSGLSAPPSDDGNVDGSEGEGFDYTSDLESGRDGVDDADDEDDVEGEDDDKSNESDSDNYVPTKATKRSTSARRPRTTQSSSNTATASQPSSRRRTRTRTSTATATRSTDLSSPAPDDSNDSGNAMPTRRLKSKATAQSKSTSTSKSTPTSEETSKVNHLQSRGQPGSGTPAGIRTGTRRRLRRDSTRVTSPYFQG
ncbi:uncharacterized protein Z520_10703 [Fonsecaea multimorphosa CBS 102226]|uniref:Rad4 beta-hairpin domain-containing protein n=1 Tax=Fonsecaea multimorphosa CBS 102226 TaxID=1442371 RepID=A0A0D2GVC2_9EURO|nr:uncharacterized protein Z520_10703 [Fonsecaea multimorphosa CBS 102226]KIX93525.1 hypothetical protein Z520_10703 [Fonsecaea multimorphosa CBS 102226]OAL18840.1 hypothetical protein AYO22_10169 [Fonsecaea multimorphosa]